MPGALIGKKMTRTVTHIHPVKTKVFLHTDRDPYPSCQNESIPPYGPWPISFLSKSNVCNDHLIHPMVQSRIILCNLFQLDCYGHTHAHLSVAVIWCFYPSRSSTHEVVMLDFTVPLLNVCSVARTFIYISESRIKWFCAISVCCKWQERGSLWHIWHTCPVWTIDDLAIQLLS